MLEEYGTSHSPAEIEVYRQNSASIRIRIVNPEFQGLSKVEREDHVWKLLDQLPDQVGQDISWVLLLTPQEKKSSMTSREFDEPIPSRL